MAHPSTPMDREILKLIAESANPGKVKSDLETLNLDAIRQAIAELEKLPVTFETHDGYG